VDDEVVLLAVVGHELPLHADGEPGATAAAVAGFLHELDQFGGAVTQGLAQGLVSLELLVDVELPGARREPALGDDGLELGEDGFAGSSWARHGHSAHFASSLSF